MDQGIVTTGAQARTGVEAARHWLAERGHGRAARIRSLGGGDTCAAWELRLESGERFFLKSRSAAPAGMFAAEALGLAALARAEAVRVPAVIHAGDEFLLLEFIAPGRASPAAWRRLGRALARMHAAAAPCFGFDTDNWCSASPQPNPRMTDGYEFFACARLMYQGRRAYDAGLLDRSLLRALEDLAQCLRARIPVQAPALLHGDLWQGNVIADAAGEAVLIDPAAHWGWPEADIAMTRLFGGFPEEFYAGYRECRPLDSGWERRLPLYNLYHLLNHLNLFGRAWLPRVHEALASP